MKSSNPRIALYKEAMSLENKRATLQHQLDDVHKRLNAIRAELFGQELKSTVSRTVERVRAGGRAVRGTLKTQILEALAAAGKAGIQVKDLADSMGAKLPNIHAWFQSVGKRIPSLKKIGRGRYRLHGSVDVLKEPKATKAKAGDTRGKRGALSASILKALNDAGSQGVKIQDLAKSLKINPKNLFIWFATTGKKNKAIKKVGEAHYRLAE